MPKILIIDDEALIRESVKDILGGDYTYAEASNGQEALSCLKNQKFDLIITDYHMPELNGLEFVRELVFRKVTTPIIWMTGHIDASRRRDTWILGVYDHIEKPFEPRALSQLVQNALLDQSSGLLTNTTRQHLFDEVNLHIRKSVISEFTNHCSALGKSPSSVVEELLIQYNMRFHKKDKSHAS